MSEVVVDNSSKGNGEIPLHLIVESDVALRGVNRQAEKYLQLVESIRQRGVLNSITVREIRDAVGNVTYGLIDGLQRFTASKDAGRSTIPANIVRCDDAELLEAQIIANIHKIETRPAEYTKQLIRILSGNPLMTIADLAKKLCQSKSWVEARLSLNKLDEAIQQLVDTDQIKLSNAYALAKLPIEEQKDFVDRAMTDPPGQFVPLIHARVKEIRDAKKEGKVAREAEWVATPHLRKMSELKDEFDAPGTYSKSVIAESGATTLEEAFHAAIAWALNMNPNAVKDRKARDAERRAMRAEEAAKRKAEREQRKAEEAAKKAADISSL